MIRLQKATLDDITAMREMVVDEINDGVILNRTSDEVATNIRSYILAKDDKSGKIVGYGALHIHSVRLAEIRSLIVSSEYRGCGVGRDIVANLLKEAKELRVGEDVLVLTYLPEFFKRLGFVEIAKENIPEHKIWADCIKCIHFPICNEVALVYKV